MSWLLNGTWWGECLHGCLSATMRCAALHWTKHLYPKLRSEQRRWHATTPPTLQPPIPTTFFMARIFSSLAITQNPSMPSFLPRTRIFIHKLVLVTCLHHGVLNFCFTMLGLQGSLPMATIGRYCRPFSTNKLPYFKHFLKHSISM